jgi:hypothetical protein
MSNVQVIRAALTALMGAVPKLGVVHGYERYHTSESQFKELFVADIDGQEVLRGWWLRRTATAERSLGVGRNVEVNTWTIRGYMGLNDELATELQMEALVEALRDKVRTDPTLGGVCGQSPIADSGNVDGLQVQDMGPVVFCGVLCHAAVLQLTTWSYL